MRGKPPRLLAGNFAGFYLVSAAFWVQKRVASIVGTFQPGRRSSGGNYCYCTLAVFRCTYTLFGAETRSPRLCANAAPPLRRCVPPWRSICTVPSLWQPQQSAGCTANYCCAPASCAAPAHRLLQHPHVGNLPPTHRRGQHCRLLGGGAGGDALCALEDPAAETGRPASRVEGPAGRVGLPGPRPCYHPLDDEALEWVETLRAAGGGPSDDLPLLETIILRY